MEKDQTRTSVPTGMSFQPRYSVGLWEGFYAQLNKF